MPNVAPGDLKEIRSELVRLHADDKSHRHWEWRTIGGGAVRGELESKIVGPRSFAGRRIKQLCRWISTTVFVALVGSGLEKADIVEIQATVYPPSKTEEPNLYIAANGKDALTKMEDMFRGRPAKDVLSGLITEDRRFADKKAGEAQKLGFGPRLDRHPRKLASFLKKGHHPHAKDKDVDDVAAVWKALGRQAVVAGVPPQDKWHAEMRLAESIAAEHNGADVKLDPNKVGGMMRPCVFCYLALYTYPGAPETDVGLLWLTAPAGRAVKKGKKTPKEIAAWIHEEIPHTSLTEVPGQEPTYRIDSESDSDKSAYDADTGGD